MAKDVQIDLIVDPKKAIKGIDDVSDRAETASKVLAGLGGFAAGALAVGAAGAAALGGAVVSAYADFEQLAGGVDKLFGDASDSVMEYASRAAESAGLSTNRYLDTVTSFSASLISGLGGDQAKAAQIADIAITDMADNANTFGTSMEMLQTTYQGFAKGQFAMLDNLKLGYGGTAGEMARLINDSGVLNGAFEVTAQNVKDIPFSTMVEAIHQVQTELNITGTTAKEAASTITGSFEATKASLMNLVTGLGDANADFDALVSSLATNAGNLIANVAGVLEQLATGLPQIVPTLLAAVEKLVPTLLEVGARLVEAVLDGLIKMAPALISGAVPLILNLVTGLLRQVPALLTAGVQIVVAVVQGIARALPTLIPSVVKAIVNGILTLTSPTNLNALLKAGLGLVTGLVKGIITALPIIIDALPTIILNIVNFIVGAIPQLIDAGIQLFMSIVAALPDIIHGIVAAIPKIIVGITTALVEAIPALITGGIELFVALIAELPTIIVEIVKAIPEIVVGIVTAFTKPETMARMAQAGMSLIQGLIDGIGSMVGAVVKSVEDVANSIVGGIADFLGIHSPSTVFADIGRYSIMGLEKGLSGRNNISSIMGKLSGQVAGGFAGALAADAKITVARSYGAADESSVTAPRSITVNNTYNVGDQDPRLVGRQAGREVMRQLAGVLV
ncbi:MAG TPA: hypothetical protein VNR37_03510 [Microbacteriaceae bacterium]|nr:hypothetical protein [Microbacteriaceae bacterium]